MYKDSRLQQIMNILNSVGKIKTSELATKIYVSQSTLRRDLVLLEKQNMISRKFGYVSLLGKANLEFPYSVREQENVKGKKYICEKQLLLLPTIWLYFWIQVLPPALFQTTYLERISWCLLPTACCMPIN